jgi:hypothetical protein
MLSVDKDSFLLILWNLEPRDALALRATCKLLDERVKKAQVYWFYKFKEYQNRQKSRNSQKNNDTIGKGKLVHFASYGEACIREFGTLNTYRLLLEHNPEDLELGAYNLVSPRRQIHRACMQRKHLLASLPGFQCRHPSHNAIIYDESDCPKNATPEMTEQAGLYVWHYLFACYHQFRKHIKRWTKTEESAHIRKNTIDSMRLQIAVLDEKRKRVATSLALLEKFETLQKDMEICPFKRRKPETYHK